MRNRPETSRLSLWIPTSLYNRLNMDSFKFGITKTAIVQTAILDYYRRADADYSATAPRVSSGKAVPEGAGDTP